MFHQIVHEIWTLAIGNTREGKTQKSLFYVGDIGFYDCKRMCFGLTNVPDTFNAKWKKCKVKFHLKECLIFFLKDILIFSKTFEEHCQLLKKVFKQLAHHEFNF